MIKGGNYLLFSVIVPVYNGEKYLEQCIESVLKQTINDFEIIIVNDGSTDSSSDICNRMAIDDSRITVIHQSNSGPLVARKTAIENAKGDFCLFLDSDDYFEPNLLKEVKEAVTEINCDLCIYKWYNDEGKGVKSTYPGTFEHKTLFTEENKDIFYKKLITTNELNSLWIKAVKTEILKNNKKDYMHFKNVKRTEDLLYSLDIFTEAKTILYLDRPLYNYRITNYNSATKSFNPNSFSNDTQVRKELLKYLSIWGINDLQTLQTFYNWYIRYSLRIMKASFMIGINSKQKDALINNIINEEFVYEALNNINIDKFSKLDKLEIDLLRNKRTKTLYILNTMIFNKFVAKPLIKYMERKKVLSYAEKKC